MGDAIDKLIAEKCGLITEKVKAIARAEIAYNNGLEAAALYLDTESKSLFSQQRKANTTQDYRDADWLGERATSYSIAAVKIRALKGAG